jgi:phosphoglycerate dehydrogenase-like enzyme
VTAEPKIALLPFTEEGLENAVRSGGGRLVDAAEADGIVWTNPGDPQGLAEVLENSRARWVQLPFAGIESFFDAGVISSDRVWTCTKGVYGPACAEHALALMLAAARRLRHHFAAKTWRMPGPGSPERMLEGMTAVIVGTGGIGSALVPLVTPLGVRSIGVNRSGTPLEGAANTITVDRMHEVLPEADFVVIAAALTPQTKGLIDAHCFEQMKEGAWIVNVARGGLVDTDALIAALRSGHLGGAALDVTDPEPLPDDHELWDMDNVLITPHIANTWDMALPVLRAVVERNVAHFANDEELEGLVFPEHGY